MLAAKSLIPTICTAISIAALLLAAGVWQSRPGSPVLANGYSGQGQLVNSNTHTPYATHRGSNVTGTPANRLYLDELSARIHVSDPSQTQSKLKTSSKHTRFKSPAHRKCTKRRRWQDSSAIAEILTLLWFSAPTAAILPTVNSDLSAEHQRTSELPDAFMHLAGNHSRHVLDGPIQDKERTFKLLIFCQPDQAPMSLDKSNFCAHDRILDNEQMPSSGALLLGNNHLCENCENRGVTLCMCRTQISRQSCLPCSTLDHASHIPIHAANLTLRNMWLCSQDTCNCSPDSDTWVSRTTSRNVKPSTHRSKNKNIADYAPHRSIQATNLTLEKVYSQGICNWTTDSDGSPQQLTTALGSKLNTNKPMQVIFDWLKNKSLHTFPVNLFFTTSTQLYSICKTAFTLLTSAACQCLTLLPCSVCHVLPILTTSVWLSLTMLAVATQTFTPLAKARPNGARWHNSCTIQLCTIFASLLTINMYIVTSIHPTLHKALTFNPLLPTCWFSACSSIMSLPLAYAQIVDAVAEAIAHAIQTLVNKPKSARFQHPRFRSGMYWRRIRNRTRKLHRQMIYKYVKLLYQLHTYLKTPTYQQHHSAMNDKHTHSKNNTGKQDERAQSSPMGSAHKDDEETKSKAETNTRKRQKKPKKERLQDRQRTVFEMHAPSATHIEPNAKGIGRIACNHTQPHILNELCTKSCTHREDTPQHLHGHSPNQYNMHTRSV